MCGADVAARINLEVSLQNYQVAKDLVRQYFATPKPSAKVSPALRRRFILLLFIYYNLLFSIIFSINK